MSVRKDNTHTKLGSNLYFILISIVLITSITSVPAIQSQSPIQTQTQPSTTDNSQIVKEVAEKIATANPGTNATFVEQILTELTRQSAQVSNQGNVLEEIYSQVSTYPYGIVSQSLARFARVLSTDNSILLPTVQKIIQEKATGKSIPQSIVNIAVQEASGGGKNVNDEIALAAQIIAKQSPGLPVRNIESIIIQMALEISRAQGKAITGQSIFEVASQIKQNPNGVLTQAIIQLAKQDTHDGGKTGQTTKTIQKIVKTTDSNGGESEGNAKQQNDNKPLQSVILPSPSLTPGATPSLKVQSDEEKWGNIFRGASKELLPPSIFQQIDDIVKGASDLVPSLSQGGLLTALVDLTFRVLNDGGQSQAAQTLDNLQTNMKSNPTLLHKVGQLASLYQTGDDVSAAHTSDIVANKLVAGINPEAAIEETPIPEPNALSLIDETEPLTSHELARVATDGQGGFTDLVPLTIKSLPPYNEATNISAVESGSESSSVPGTQDPNGTGILESEPPPELASIQDVPETSILRPMSEPAPSFKEQITSLPPQETTSAEDQSSGTIPLTASTLNECLIDPGLCQQQEPIPQAPIVDVCEEQWYLPQCTQYDNDNGEDIDIEYSDTLEESAVSNYYYENVGSYQEEEEQYSEDYSEEEEDYEEVGGYQAAEEDYSEEEDSGDEEDDYEEVGGYQEEEAQYTEVDNEEEEDFSEEEDESREYYEE